MIAPAPDPFLSLTDDASVEQAAAVRAAVRDRLHRAAETATWVGTLRDLAERRQAVTVHTAGDRATLGLLVGVANDHVIVRRSDGVTALIMRDAVCWIRPSTGAPAPLASGNRPAPTGPTLSEALARHLEVDSDIGLVMRETGEVMTGTVAGFGEDVLTIRMSGGPAVAYVSLAAVSEVLVRM